MMRSEETGQGIPRSFLDSWMEEFECYSCGRLAKKVCRCIFVPHNVTCCTDQPSRSLEIPAW